MKVLVIGDTHIDDPYLDELSVIFDEILSYEADCVLHLGDYYNQSRPTPAALSFGTKIAKRIVEKYGKFTILSGNGRHNWLNNHSIIDYLSSLGVECVGKELERSFDGLRCFFGHYMTNESYKEYGSHEYTVKELKKYNLVLLGHQHIPQEITPQIHHLGSVFYQHFNEVEDTHKRIAIVENGKLEFIPLKSPVPMTDVTSVSELENLDPKNKVRLLISNFETFKRYVNGLNKWKEKFVEFKYELRYDKTSTRTEKKQHDQAHENRRTSIIEEINRLVKDKAVKELLLAQFKVINA